ncbi:hypothetical protein ATCC90586_004024 [Pythium insidiosum]|nr:hypothetical protein ATCC90586_004024 [Pythium insidiosum]
MGAAASDYFTSYADVQYGYLDAELGIENFHELAAKGDVHRVSICLKKGLDPNGARFDDEDEFEREDTPMICAARGHLLNKGTERHLKTLEVLHRFGGDVNRVNVLEQSALWVACERNLLPIASWLLAHGADANRATRVGVTPLMCASRHQNAALVELLLQHGARAVEPPKTFCRVQFPSLSTVLDDPLALDRRRPRPDIEIDSGDEDEDEDEEDDRLPSWLPRRTMEQRPPEASQRVRDVVERHREQQRQARAEMMQVLDDQRRIEEQRVYRQQLANDNAKRKNRRRQLRAKAKYDKFLATIEDKRRQQLGLSRMVLDGDDDGDGVDGPCASSSDRPSTVPAAQRVARPQTRSSSSGAGAGSRRRAETAPAVVGLSWQRTTPSDSRAQSRGGRPTWVPQELWSLHDVHATAANDAMVQCEQLHNALQQTHARKERLRAVYSAPDAEMLRQQQPQAVTGGGDTAATRRAMLLLPTLRARPETAP